MSDCMFWPGALSDGYGIAEVGHLYDDGKRHRTLAHRAMWMEEYGLLHPDIVLHHTCHNRPCVNLEHLEPLHRDDHSRMHAERTHCSRGHEYSPENTYRAPKTGWRQCRRCWSIRRRERRTALQATE